jgi:hypothetical protein
VPRSVWPARIGLILLAAVSAGALAAPAHAAGILGVDCERSRP